MGLAVTVVVAPQRLEKIGSIPAGGGIERFVIKIAVTKNILVVVFILILHLVSLFLLGHNRWDKASQIELTGHHPMILGENVTPRVALVEHPQYARDDVFQMCN